MGPSDVSVVQDVLAAVAAWYSQEIGAERSKAEIDQARINWLLVNQRSAARVMQDLSVMGPKELVETEKKYREQLERLTRKAPIR